MNQDEAKKKENYGHNSMEWGSKDESEMIEWEKYYKNRNRRWMGRGITENEFLMTELEATCVDTDFYTEDDRYD